MAQPVRCPRDGAEARTEKHPGRLLPFRLDVCPTCRGIFFDKGEIAKLTGDRNLERLIVEYAGGVSRVNCPRCEEAMVPRPVGDVTIDVCATCHGAWMDRGELEIAAKNLGVPIDAPYKGASAIDLTTSTFLSPSMIKALQDTAWRGPLGPK